MALIAGLILIALSATSFIYSLPRGGNTARFVGTEWEGYVVTTMIGTAGIGCILALAGIAALMK